MIPTNSAYGRAVMEEVTRVANPDGVVFGVTMDGGTLQDLHGSGDFDSQYVPFHPSAADGSRGFYFMGNPEYC